MKYRKPRRIYSPSDKAKMTMGGYLIGRISLKQFKYLRGLGADAKTIKHWSMDRASKEFARRLDIKRDRRRVREDDMEELEPRRRKPVQRTPDPNELPTVLVDDHSMKA